MPRPMCGYCWRTSVATLLVSTWFGWRKQWRHVCRDHIRRAGRRA